MPQISGFWSEKYLLNKGKLEAWIRENLFWRCRRTGLGTV